MAAAYLTVTRVDAVLGADQRAALLSDDNTVAGYNSTYFTLINNQASALVKAAARNAGFTLGDTTTDDIVIQATLGQFIKQACGRKSVAIPEALGYLVEMIVLIADGTLTLGDPTVKNAVGGFTWSDQSTTSADGLPAVFTRKTLMGY